MGQSWIGFCPGDLLRLFCSSLDTRLTVPTSGAALFITHQTDWSDLGGHLILLVKSPGRWHTTLSPREG